MIDGAEFNVLDYGAVGDGITDDTTAIQDAIDAAAVLGGVVFFPANVYLVQSGITLKTKVSLRGEGRNNVSEIKRTATGGPVITIDQSTGVMGAVVEELKIRHTGTASADRGIYWARTTNPGFTFCSFRNLDVTGYDGLYFAGDAVGAPIWNTFDQVKAISCVNYGFYFSGVANQNVFLNCASAYSGNDGIRFALSGGSSAQNIALINFASEYSGTSAANAVSGLWARGVAGLLIDNFYGENNGPDSNFGAAFGVNSAHIWLQDCSGVEIRGGTFNKANYGICLTSTLAKISGCNFYEIGAFTNRKFSIGYQTNSRIELGPNRFPSATVPMLNDADNDALSLTGVAPQTASANVFNSLVASRKFFVATGDPATITADVGDFAVARTAASGAVDMWRQISSGVWRPIAQSVRFSTTANRPTLRAQDIGVMYMDTTLAAGGKPIWWNGTAWVDSTGATV